MKLELGISATYLPNRMIHYSHDNYHTRQLFVEELLEKSETYLLSSV